jgi:uncharacterized Zn finger protein (UPF0148 family)
MESDPMLKGRVAVLRDLQRRAGEAESTHDPKVIQQLCTALNAFLDAQLGEAASALAKARRGDESEAGHCEACGHDLENAERKNGEIVCPGCGHQIPASASAPAVTPENESDDPGEEFMPYFPAPEDESEDESEDEVHAIRHKHKRRKRETASRIFRRALRGDSPRLSRHLGPVETFAALCPVPPRASASPRPVSAASAQWKRRYDGTAERGRIDRMVAAGEAPADVFKSLMSR